VRLDAGPRPDRRIKTPSRFPASSIDLAFVVDDAVAAGDVAATLRSAAGELCETVKVFDLFRSDALGPDRKSLAYALRFRAPDRTLTDAEVGELRTACINAVSSAHGAELRG
jgi:phenylalanyl-tRNA synthetase beta chain